MGGDFRTTSRSATRRRNHYHLVKIWEGNDETVHYFHSETALAKFGKENPDLGLFGEDEEEEDQAKRRTRNQAPRRHQPSEAASRRKEGPRRRARHVELHEHTAVEEILSKLNRKGLSVDHYSAQDEPLFEIIQGEGDSANARRLFSISEILNAVMDVGRRGHPDPALQGAG